MFKLMRGDCIELMKGIPDNSIDFVLCDPPYGITRAAWDKEISPAAMMAEYARIIKPNGAIALFSMLPFACHLIDAAPHLFRYEIIWKKTIPVGFLNANRMPLRAHENILIFYKRLPTYNPQKWKSNPYRKTVSHSRSQLLGNYGDSAAKSPDGLRFPIDVIEFSNAKQKGEKEHQTGKPVPLLEWLIKTYTNPGETVLDNTMGFGSTGVACLNTGREFIGMEMNPGFFQKAVDRIEGAVINAAQ